VGSVLCGEDKNIFLFYFEVRHRRCFGSITNNCCVLLCIVVYCCVLCIVVYCVLLCIAHRVEHNYISPGSTVGIQLHVSALYVGHFQVVI